MLDRVEDSAAEQVVRSADSGEHGRLSLDDQATQPGRRGITKSEMVAREDPSCATFVPTDPARDREPATAFEVEVGSDEVTCVEARDKGSELVVICRREIGQIVVLHDKRRQGLQLRDWLCLLAVRQIQPADLEHGVGQVRTNRTGDGELTVFGEAEVRYDVHPGLECFERAPECCHVAAGQGDTEAEVVGHDPQVTTADVCLCPWWTPTEFRASSSTMPDMPPAALPGLSFTAIDFETANPQRASVCAVGVVKVRDGIVVDALETLVQPPPGHESFNYRNVGVHGIQAHHVVGAPAWDVVYTKVMEFAGGDALVAHNASFDRSVMARASEVYGIRASPSPWLCTRDAARSALDLPSYRLPEVSAALSIPAHAHHEAGADARQCALVLVELCRRRGSSWRDLVRSHVRVA